MKDQTRNILSKVAIGVASLALGFGIGYVTYRYLILSKEEQKLLSTYRLLKDDWLYGNEEAYLDQNAQAGLVYGMANGDPYTFYTKSVAEQNLSTDYTAGFGFSSHPYDGGLYLTTIHEGDNAGKIFKGDILWDVTRDDEETFVFKDHSYREITDYLADKDHVKSKYVFTREKDGKKDKVTLTRGRFSEKIVETLTEPSQDNNYTMVLKINTFLGSPSAYLKAYLDTYLSIPDNRIDTLVFDLRGNGGGYVGEALGMAKLFVKKDTLIYAAYNKEGKKLEEDYQKDDPRYSFLHYKVIVDHNSASASELFTLAMRAGAKATVYGTQSYGKGIAQNFKTFSDNSVIRYTYAYVYGPRKSEETLTQKVSIPLKDDRICIQGTGIVPDVMLEKDYTGYQRTYDYTTSSSYSLAAMNYFINAYNEIYHDHLAINQQTHFDDIIEAFTQKVNEEFSQDYPAFNALGAMNKDINDKFDRKTFDYYLEGYQRLTKMTIGGDEHD